MSNPFVVTVVLHFVWVTCYWFCVFKCSSFMSETSCACSLVKVSVYGCWVKSAKNYVVRAFSSMGVVLCLFGVFWPVSAQARCEFL